MQREVTRDKTLSPFSINIADLEALFLRLLKLFPEPANVYCVITITLKREVFTFDSVEELKKYSDLKGQISKFSIRLSEKSEGKKEIALRSTAFRGVGYVQARAENEAWCAGAVETAYSFLQSFTLWYGWLYTQPIGPLFFVLGLGPYALSFFGLTKFLPHDIKVSWPVLISYLGSLLVIGFFFMTRENLFPATVLRITDETGFIRRNSAELGLLIALISAVLTVVGFFVGK